jgi:sec-independent protein translocase protein TatC
MDEKTYTLIEHLDEFRTRLIKCTLCVALVFVPANYISLPAIVWIKQYFCPQLKELVFNQPLEIFFTQLKVSFYMALIVSAPFIAYQLWSFVAPALFKKERRYVVSLMLISTVLFVTGAFLALFIVFPALMRFSMSLAGDTGAIIPMINVQSFISTAAVLMLAFGIMFQLPLVVFALTATGLISVEKLAHGRPYAIVIIFILSAVLTPGPDVLSQLAMAVPTCVLFEISLLFCRMLEKKKQAEAAILAEADPCN